MAIIKSWISYLCLIVSGISSAIFITINSSWLFKMTLSAAILNASGLSRARLIENYNRMLAYLQIPWIKFLELPDFPFSEHGLIHMAEVKNLFLLNFGIMVISIIGTVLIYKVVRKQGTWWQFINLFKNAAIITPMLAFFIGMDFDECFYAFHRLFFRNQYWIFDAHKDPIINVLTDQFFVWCGLSIFIIFELYLLISYHIIKKQ